MIPSNEQRYAVVAIALHWAIAASILGNLIIGWWMHSALDDPATRARAIAGYQLHKSIGLTTLLLSLVRLAWRMMNPPPPLPDGMSPWERRAAHATHFLLYFLMIAIPVTGWIYVSTGWSTPLGRALEVPTIFFGLFEVPHLFDLNEMTESMRRFAADTALEIHELLAFGMVGLFLLHVVAALKHHFVDHDGILARMVPWIATENITHSPKNWSRSIALAISFLPIFAGTIAVTFQLLHIPATQGVPSSRTPVIEPPQSTQQTAEAPKAEAQPVPQTVEAQPASQPVNDTEVPRWQVEYTKSSIAFTGVHVGTPFRGTFSRWQADVHFNPDNLASSQATVVIQTASASDGVAMHDSSLPGEEWFNVERYPTATFRTGKITKTASGYLAKGTLTIKGRAIPVDFPFTLNIRNDRAELSGHARISRSQVNLGMESDPGADYVDPEIGIEVAVSAKRVK